MASRKNTPPSERDLLLLEVERIRKQELSPTEVELQRYLQCAEARNPSQIVGRCLHYRSSSKLMEIPTAALPWLG